MTDTKQLTWGLLSTARINRALIPPIRKSKQSRLAAVASRSLEKGQAYAYEWGIPRVYGSYEELLADPEIDVIYNPLPNSLHAEWSIKAVQAGKHVLCEKPLAISLAEVDAMCYAASQTGKVIAEAFMYRHHPQTLFVKELVTQGKIGELQWIHGTFTYPLSRPENVRLVPELGGGSLWDVGCYPISYARYIAGTEPVEVFGWQTTSPAGIDLSYTGQMRFPGNVFAQFTSSFITSYKAEIVIVGKQGRLTVPNPFNPGKSQKIILKRGDETETIRIPGMDLYLGEVQDMEAAALHGMPARLSLEESRNNVAAILAFIESAFQGKPQTLS